MSTTTSSDLRSDWQRHLAHVVETVREMSTHTEPQAMVRKYGERMRKILPSDRMVALSRRDLPAPKYRITRSSLWKDEVNPWLQKDKLPLMEGGLLGELIYGDQPRIINDLRIDESDPAYSYLSDQRSLVALPNYDNGVALNMVLLTQEKPNAFKVEDFPDLVLSSNLFGRATHNLVLSKQLNDAYQEVDRELIAIANMQRSLLPEKLPEISTMGLAAHYQTSRRAGGDYYDPHRRCQRSRHARSGHHGRHPQHRPLVSESTMLPLAHAQLCQRTIVQGVYQRQFDIRDGVLWRVRSRIAATFLRLRRAQSTASETLRRWVGLLARQGRGLTAGN